jgi:hypothetical protein
MSPLEIIVRALLLLLPGLVVGLAGWLSYHWRGNGRRAHLVLTLAGVLLFASSGLAYLYHLPAFIWVAQFLLALPGLVLALAGSRVFSRVRTMLVVPRHWEIVLLASSPLLLIGALWKLHSMTEPVIFELENSSPHLLTREAGATAYTDQGRQVHLFELKPESRESFDVTGDQGLITSDTPVPYRSIRLTEADGQSNCVGWIFTGGHHLLQCSDVEMILEDNGYQQVKAPRAGDLVIYRNDGEAITHAGRVAFILNEGQPMIESKWGYQGVFLHLPDGSPFGLNWAYYRSARSNHHLLLSDPPALDEMSDVAGAEILP